MSIDIKRLLYSYHKLQVSLANIRESIKREQGKRQYPSCTPMYNDDIKGRGGLPNSQTERYALFNVELDDKAQYLMWDAEEHEYVIGLIESAFKTLSERQKELIRLTYFEDRGPIETSMMMSIGESRYYHIHRLAMDGINQCLNGSNIFINRLIPTKNNIKSSRKTRVLSEISVL